MQLKKGTPVIIQVLCGYSPDCSLFWQHWDPPDPDSSHIFRGLCSSNTPPHHTCTGSDKPVPGYSTAWPHLGDLCPGPGHQQRDILPRRMVKNIRVQMCKAVRDILEAVIAAIGGSIKY